MKYLWNLFLALALLTSCNSQPERIDLSGEWTFKTDPLDKGVEEQWFDASFAGQVALPGSMASNGKGEDIDVNTHWTGGIVDKGWFNDEKYAPYREPGNIKIPFWLQPVKKYYGAAWYQKQVNVPKSWTGKKILLNLERCHWETQVWLNGAEVGMQNSLSTPNVFDLTSFAEPGENSLVIRIDNRIKDIDPGINAHSVSDHTQTNWNGMVGHLYLEARPMIFIKKMALYPDVENRSVKVKLLIENGGEAQQAKVKLKARGKEPLNRHNASSSNETLDLKGGTREYLMDYPMNEEANLWDEFAPNLYTMQAELNTSAGKDVIISQFGMRDFSVEGTQFRVNGRPIFLRGTLECAIFPKTGYPATEKAEWARIYQVIKSHGLNHVRFHSWCPPEAAFEAADEAGVYLQVESASWATIGDGAPIDSFIYRETQRIIDAYANHPSFCMMAYGNEPGGGNQVKYLTDYIHHFSKDDKRHLFTGGAGWPVMEANRFHNIPQPRLQGWGEGLNSLINSQPPRTDFNWSERIRDLNKPVVSHEIGQWCVYPNLKETSKYTGVLKAKNFEIFEASLRENGMAHLADSFLLASGKLQALCYKHDIEAALRTPGFAGFQLLDLHDFPGQGTALVGVLDAFWEEKGYITPDEFSKFSNTTVPLAALAQMIFEEGETLAAEAQVAHFGPSGLTGVKARWRLSGADGEVVESGELPSVDIPTGGLTSLGKVVYEFKNIEHPQMLKFSIQVDDFENDWEVWVYPKKESLGSHSDILITRELNDSALSTLASGGKVLLTPPRGSLVAKAGGDIAVGFSSIFWNTAWTGNQPPHTLGVLVNPGHPVFHYFPTQYHSNWQWWDAMTHSNAIVLSEVDDQIEPLVRVVDDWFTNRPLALLFEVRVGKGKLMVSGIDFLNDLENRPALVRQRLADGAAGKQLMHSVLKYMETPAFNPEIEVEAEKIGALFNP